jgi:hypothetical protein
MANVWKSGSGIKVLRGYARIREGGKRWSKEQAYHSLG